MLADQYICSGSASSPPDHVDVELAGSGSDDDHAVAVGLPSERGCA